jgi:hypothetical protein
MTQDIKHKNKKSPNRNSEPTTMWQNELQTDKNTELYYVYFGNKDTCSDSQMLCKMSFFLNFLRKGGVIPSF